MCRDKKNEQDDQRNGDGLQNWPTQTYILLVGVEDKMNELYKVGARIEAKLLHF